MPLTADDLDEFNRKDDLVDDIMLEFQAIRTGIQTALDRDGEYPVAFAITALLDQVQQLATYVIDLKEITVTEVLESAELEDAVGVILADLGWYEDSDGSEEA